MSMIRRRPNRSTRGFSAPPNGQAPVMLAKLLELAERDSQATRGQITPAAPTNPGQLASRPYPDDPATFATPSLFTDPSRQPGFTSGTTTRAVPVSHGGRTYTVRSGDTVLSVAARHGVSAPALIDLNNLRGRTELSQGQVLSLPEKNHDPVPSGYRVRPGDTLGAIAARHSTTAANLRRANAMGDSSLIVEGEVLSLRGAGATSDRPQPHLDGPLPRLPREHDGRPYPDAVVRAARINKYILRLRPAPTDAWVKATVRSVAAEFGVPADLAIAVAVQESGLHHHTVSPVNAVGIMQVTPRSGAWASGLIGRRLNIMDPADNVVAGVAILHRLLATQDDEAAALAAYYQGSASVAAHGRAPDTRAFVHGVQVTRTRYGGDTA